MIRNLINFYDIPEGSGPPIHLPLDLCMQIQQGSIVHIKSHSLVSCADPEGGTGGLDPLKNQKAIGFESNTGPDPLKVTKLPMLGPLPASQ